ncbi:unnamed protein product [Adineta steineri]|uniref:SWIM-type domain-containing protein n=1 Tax=Adineta steineri TaxID=433720 RepID=A0A815SMK4_9BILA|nr:unnamed protein product [Adineta steineri]CAF4190601.1 unnamed protein product [Adineta steineri]
MEQGKDSFFSKDFDSWKDFENNFKDWCDKYYQPVNIKRSSMKYNEKMMKELFNRFRYEHVKYTCHHGGSVRRNIKDGSRPNQESARIHCGFYFTIKHDMESNKIVFMKNKNLNHNHPIEEKIYKNYPFIRSKKLQENEDAYNLCTTLITANASTYNNRKLINQKFDINLTRKDINNIKQKLKFNLIGNSTDPELLQSWIDEMLSQNKINSVQIKTDENGILQCLFIQTSQMKTWFEKYINIAHIDSTFKINIENYQLYVCLVQNANLKGVPVAYCLMNSGIKENLEFFYAAMSKNNDLTKTQVVIVDKDLTNIDILQQYFNNAKILLCVFHVLKYLKSQINVLRIPLENRMNIMKNVRRLLYDNDQMSAIYLEDIKTNSEGTNFYEYFEINWLSCCEMWQTKYRKCLFNFGTDTNNHIERFNRTLKAHISSKMHISECVQKLVLIADDAKTDEMNIDISLKQKIYNYNDPTVLKRFGFQITNKAIELLRKQNEELKYKRYFIEEIEENRWKIGQKDEQENDFITSSIVYVNSYDDYDLLSCNCIFYVQNELPCRHMMALLDTSNDDLYEQANNIQEIFAINKRWLKHSIDYYINDITDNDVVQNVDPHFIITQTKTQKNTILNNNDKYNKLKPTLDLLLARITECGTDEFIQHVNYLNILLDLISVNKHNKLYDFANSLKDNVYDNNDRNTVQDCLTNLCNDINEEVTAKEVNSYSIAEVEKQSHIELTQEEYEGKFFEEKEKDILILSILGLQSEEAVNDEYEGKSFAEKQKDLSVLGLQLDAEAKEKCHTPLKEKITLNYSPVVKPVGRPRGKVSLVSYKKKDNGNNDNDINKKRNFKQVSPDAKRVNYKRNKKVDSVRDVYDNTLWLTDFHIYLFFDMLHEQFPHINGLCGPAQIKFYNGSLKNSIFIFNVNNKHWLTISNLNSDDIWNVYDSLSGSKELLVKFFKDILPDEEKVSVYFQNVQQQIGGNDCGLFALAFATSLCYQEVPSLLCYDQRSLRNHYVQCIESNKVQPFPSKSRRGSTRNVCKLVDIYLN